MPKPANLTLTLNQKRSDVPPPLKSPHTPHHSPTTMYARRHSAEEELPDTSNLPALPQSPASPSSSHDAQAARPPASLLSRGREPIRKVTSDSSTVPGPYASGPGSVASMSHGNLLETASSAQSETTSLPETVDSEQGTEAEPERPYERSHSITASELQQPLGKKSRAPRFNQLLAHTRSMRKDAAAMPPRTGSSNKGQFLDPKAQPQNSALPPKTAPLDPERTFKDFMGSAIRNKSADRNAVDSRDGVDVGPLKPMAGREPNRLFVNLKQSGTRAADGIGRAGRGLFGKFARSGSTGERDALADENYQFRIINLPLVEQTRRTRIRGRMEDAKDKTEFWMPALPYRCIDFLNLKGVEEEGLYRIPGSGREVKHWQARFDIEGDVNLLDEESLYDINIVCSMIKAWLRELPDELFPKSTQSQIAHACQGATETPQMLKDELSKLPPFNYYLLFAVTCHIALLHANADRNKMTYSNLCICFQPCMGIEGFCFRFLVCQWRSCWQGCWTEKEYLAEEYRVMQERQNQSALDAAPAAAAAGTPQLVGLQDSPYFLTSDERDATPSPSAQLRGGSRPGTSSDRSASVPNKRQVSPVRTTTPISEARFPAHPAVSPKGKLVPVTEPNGAVRAASPEITGWRPRVSGDLLDDDRPRSKDDSDIPRSSSAASASKSPPSTATSSAGPRSHRRTSTPPTLEPVVTISPMRM